MTDATTITEPFWNLMLFMHGDVVTVARCLHPSLRARQAAHMVFTEGRFEPSKDRLGLSKAKTFSTKELDLLLSHMDAARKVKKSRELKEKANRLEVTPDAYYRLGGQVDDVVSANVILEAAQVYWCNIEQKWEKSR